MSNVQTTVANPAIGLPGMPSDNGYNDIVSKRATEDIDFGAYVFIDGDDCSLPNVAGDVSLAKGGFAVRDPNKPTGQGYKAGDIVQVMIEGRMLVTNSAGAAAAQGTVQVVHTTGAVRGDADVGATALTGATFVRAGAAAATVEIQF